MLQQKLNYLTLVLRMREVLGSVNVLRALHDLSASEWERSRDDASDTHLIRRVHHSSTKTEAIRAYVSKIAKLYMNSIGTVTNAWTKETLASENTITQAVVNKITTQEIHTNDELFGLVAERVLGVDRQLVALSMTDKADYSKQAMLVVSYLSYLQGDVEDPKTIYRELIEEVALRLSQHALNDDFFDLLVRDAEEFFLTYEDTGADLMDLLDLRFHHVVEELKAFGKKVEAGEAELPATPVA